MCWPQDLADHLVECQTVQGSQLSWNSWNFKSVLILSWNLKLSWNFSYLVRMSWYWLLLHNNMLQFTVLFVALLCLYLFTRYPNSDIIIISCILAFSMCKIAFLTVLRLHYWCLWMICVQEKVCVYYVLSLSWPKNVPKFSKNLVLKFYFVLLGPL